MTNENWVMPEWMEQYRDMIEDRENTKTTAEQVMSRKVGAPSWENVKARILFLYAIRNLQIGNLFP